MSLHILVDSAVRSLVLGLFVGAVLKLTRLCDVRTETAVWTVVLLAALSMPLLIRHAPGPTLALTQIAEAPATAASTGSPPGGAAPGFAWAGQLRHVRAWVSGVYALGLAFCSSRILTGLILTWRLYRRAVPVPAVWAKGRNIRASRDLKSPVSFAGAILLTADHEQWSAAKREAVLAHEDAHIARRDFYVQLAALIHSAVFWFSPFAWWLQRKLAEIAETASDEAAVRHVEDRVGYAEILIEISRCAQPSALHVGMAKGPFIARRVERILAQKPTQDLGMPLRSLAIAALVTLAVTVAGAKTAVGPATGDPRITAEATNTTVPTFRSIASANAGPSASPGASAGPGASAHPRLSAHRAATANSVATTTPSAVKRPAWAARSAAATVTAVALVTYNPRALLDPVYAPRLNTVPPGLGRPVRDVFVTYAVDRFGH